MLFQYIVLHKKSKYNSKNLCKNLIKYIDNHLYKQTKIIVNNN
jgi:hypothetical protein